MARPSTRGSAFLLKESSVDSGSTDASKLHIS